MELQVRSVSEEIAVIISSQRSKDSQLNSDPVGLVEGGALLEEIPWLDLKKTCMR